MGDRAGSPLVPHDGSLAGRTTDILTSISERGRSHMRTSRCLGHRPYGARSLCRIGTLVKRRVKYAFPDAGRDRKPSVQGVRQDIFGNMTKSIESLDIHLVLEKNDRLHSKFRMVVTRKMIRSIDMMNSDLSKTSVCVFDAYGTLFDVSSAARG